MLSTLALGSMGVSTAGATTLDFGVAYQSPGQPGSAGQGGGAGLLDHAWGRLGVSGVAVGGGQLSAGVSTRAAELGYSRGLSLAPLGAASARTDLAVTWTGGVRVSSRATASLGPVALNLGGAYFTTAASSVDPLAPWALAATDLREQGWNADATVRYRVSRTLVAVLGGEFGPQHHAVLGLEGRHDLTRTLPPAPDDDSADNPSDDPPTEPATEPANQPESATEPESGNEAEPDLEAAPEPDTESLGTLSWRVGARAGQDILGITGGLTYATEAGLSLGLDALVGPQHFGLMGSLSAPELLGEGSSARLYAAYEPWRNASLPLRAGLEASLPAGPGELTLDVRGGRSAAGVTGYGARLSYRLPLGESRP